MTCLFYFINKGWYNSRYTLGVKILANIMHSQVKRDIEYGIKQLLLNFNSFIDHTK